MLDSAGEAALQGFVEDGKGFLGIGSTATVEPGSSFVNGLIGARPNNNPTTPSAQVVVPGDRVHPSTRDLPLLWNRSDLWYTWGTRPTGTVHTVARYHASNAAAGDGTTVGGTDHPISWCRDYRNGRSFYTGMGRTEAAYAEDNFRKHLLGALEWTAGLVRGDCKATINANYRGTKVISAGPTLTGLATSGESHGLSIADNGWVFYIGRGDCRTDAERGGLIGLPSLGRILDHANANVGIGCGAVHIFDPAQYTGAENSGVTRAGTLAVYGDGGQGGERTNEDNHKMEYGLLGVVADPDFSAERLRLHAVLPDLQPAELPPGLPVEPADLEDVASRASRASRSTCRPSSSTCARSGSSSSTTPRSSPAATSAAAWASTPRATSTSPPVTRTPRRAPTATRATTRWPSARRARPYTAIERALRPGELLLPGRAPNRGQHQRLQRQDAALPAAGGHRGGHAARRRAHLRAPERGLAERPEPVQGRRGRDAADRDPDQARDLRDGPA